MIQFSRGASDVVLLGGTLGDAEGVLGDYSVGSKGTTSPFLAVGAMA
jgi:hypothetical protein